MRKSFAIGLLVVAVAGLSADRAAAQSIPKMCTTTLKEVFIPADGSLYVTTAAVSNASYKLCNLAAGNSVCQAWLSVVEAALISGRKIVIRAPGSTTSAECTPSAGFPAADATLSISYVALK